jgi:hypothetical protein
VRAGEREGRIREVTDDGVVIDVNGDIETISFEELPPGHIVLEFSR